MADLSTWLDSRTRVLRRAHILGLPLLRGGEPRAETLCAIGFQHDDGLWTRGRDEIYADRVRADRPGFLTLVELEDWRAYLVRRCVSAGVAVELPVPTGDEEELLREAVRHLVQVPGLRLTLGWNHDPVAVAKLWMSRSWLSWPEVARVLLESHRQAHLGAATCRKRALAIELILVWTEPEERAPVLAQLALAHDGREVRVPPGLSQEAFAAALDSYLDLVCGVAA
jgi:hypothetical protein